MHSQSRKYCTYSTCIVMTNNNPNGLQSDICRAQHPAKKDDILPLLFQFGGYPLEKITATMNQYT